MDGSTSSGTGTAVQLPAAVGGHHDAVDAAYLDTVLDGMVHQDAPSTRKLAVTFDALRTEALAGEASLTLIDEGAEQWQALIRS